IHNTLIPYLETTGELKTKPTQHSVKELRSLGITPDIIILRSAKAISADIRDKVALFCDVKKEAVIECRDVQVLYEVMLNLKKEGLDDLVCEQLNLIKTPSNIDFFVDLVDKIKKLNTKVRIALVGKYVSLKDAYLSVSESLNHAGYALNKEIEIIWTDSSKIKKENLKEIFKDVDGILVPGGFGKRGIEGKMLAIQYAREEKIPFLGLCLGMQLTVIEFARNVCNLTEANSTEFNPDTKYNVIDYMPDQYQGINMGGTLRLGLYECEIKPGTLAYQTYGKNTIFERHRHRYEFNNEYLEIFEKNQMSFSGINPQNNLVEIIEIKNHPFFIAVQFHPEFLSRPDKPHPLFKEFIKATIK
ncbi:MAG: CTP synthase, partial [Candidatus Izemoplasmatales bacterium]|nr:CTP synthase [Candidatus Izemoplasmatales bacterium]